MGRISVIMLLFVFSAGCLHRKDTLAISFDRVDGLVEGSPVSHKGISVGEVTHLRLFGDRVLVNVELENGIRIPVGSVFSIRRDLLGSSHIDIEYSNSARVFTVNDTASGEFKARAILDDIISDTAKRKNIEKSMEKIADGIRELADAAKDTAK